MTNAPVEPEQRSSRLAALGRWGLAIGLATVGTYFVRNAIIRARARSATRLVVTDFARFQGCILQMPTPTDSEAPARVMALAQGTGDDAWPHSCATALTRLEHTADDMHGDDPFADPLAAAIRHAENGLGEAVFWTEHVRRGHPSAPEWLESYFTLRRAVESFARGHGQSLPPAEAPRHVRTPRAADATPPPPTPVALPFGTSADLLDVTATPESFAIAMRDERSRTGFCRWALTPADAPIECAHVDLPQIADPRYAAFVTSERGPHVALWQRAPQSTRALVDAAAARIVMTVAGDADAARDYYVGATAAVATQLDPRGSALLVDNDGTIQRHPLPASVDVLASDRALLGDAHGGGVLAWIDSRTHATATLLALSLDERFTPSARPAVVARWSSPRMRREDRRIVPCYVSGGTSYVVAGDRSGGTLFATTGAHTLIRGPEISLPIDPPPRVACDTHGITLAQGTGPVRFAHCTSAACTVRDDLPVSPTYAMTRTAGQLVLGDVTGESTVRVRTVDTATGAVADSRFVGDAVAARDLRLAARDQTVALFVTARETYAFRSGDGGRTFVPAIVAR